MPRIRVIYPKDFGNSRLNSVGFIARRLYQALETYADDEGRAYYKPKTIEGYAFPMDDLTAHGTSIQSLLAELIKAELIIVYQDGEGEDLYQIPGFRLRQKPEKHWPSKLDPPPPEALTKKSPPKSTELVKKPAVIVPVVAVRDRGPAFSVMEHLFGQVTRPQTETYYWKLIHECLEASGFSNDQIGGAEIQRRYQAMQVAHHDNVRAWTVANLMNKWELWGVERRPVSKKRVEQAIERQEFERMIDEL